MPEQIFPIKYTAPKIKFLTLWKKHKDTFETKTKKKKPSEKGFFGLYRKSAGIEPAFKLLDKVLAEIPEPIPTNIITATCTNPHQIIFQISHNAHRQQEWVSNFNKAVESFTKNCDAYEKLLDKSADDDEYKLFTTNVRDLKAALKMLVRKATLCSLSASRYHKHLTAICDKVDPSNKHITTISLEVKALNLALKDYGVKPPLNEKSPTLKKDIAAAISSITKAAKAAQAKKTVASKGSDLKLAEAKKKADALNESISEGTRFLEGTALRINESFVELTDSLNAE
jgi:rubrerythrin